MPHPQFQRTIQPLLDSHLIEALEWRQLPPPKKKNAGPPDSLCVGGGVGARRRPQSCDIGWGMGSLLPPWAEQLLEEFSQAGRLLGHGVLYSPTSSCWEPRQRAVRHKPLCRCFCSLVRSCLLTTTTTTTTTTTAVRMAEGGVQEAAIPAHHRTLWVPVMTAGEGCPLPLLFTPGFGSLPPSPLLRPPAVSMHGGAQRGAGGG